MTTCTSNSAAACPPAVQSQRRAQQANSALVARSRGAELSDTAGQRLALARRLGRAEVHLGGFLCHLGRLEVFRTLHACQRSIEIAREAPHKDVHDFDRVVVALPLD